MATGDPFRPISEIFAEGADQALALAHFFGYDDARISTMVDRRFGPISPSDRNQLEDFALAAIAAGAFVRGLDPSQRIPPGAIPTNPFLYGDDPEGRRVRVIGTIEFPDSGAIIRIYEDFEDLPSVQDLIDQLENKGAGIGERYPAKFGIDPDVSADARVIDIAYIGKRY